MIRSVLLFAALALTGCNQLDFLATKADPGMSGKVTAVRPSNDANMYANVTIVFENRAKKDIGVKQYYVRFTGGKYRGTANLRVPHGGQSTTQVKILPKDGDVTALINGTGAPKVEIIETFE